MKVLVIHPKDTSTDFLTRIYNDYRDDPDWNIVEDTIKYPKSQLKRDMLAADFIVMMGHGTERGLVNHNFDSVIDSSLVYILREKITVGIWCNADKFYEKYGLKGLYTGMIISDYTEAQYESVTTTYHEIDESNFKFAQSIHYALLKGVLNNDLENTKNEILEYYSVEGLNRVIDFNHKRIYHAS